MSAPEFNKSQETIDGEMLMSEVALSGSPENTDSHSQPTNLDSAAVSEPDSVSRTQGNTNYLRERFRPVYRNLVDALANWVDGFIQAFDHDVGPLLRVAIIGYVLLLIAKQAGVKGRLYDALVYLNIGLLIGSLLIVMLTDFFKFARKRISGIFKG